QRADPIADRKMIFFWRLCWFNHVNDWLILRGKAAIVPDEAALLLQSRDLFVRRPLRRDMLRQAIARLSRHITGTLAEPPGFLGDDRHPLLRRELIRIRVRIVASDKGRRHVALAT